MISKNFEVIVMSDEEIGKHLNSEFEKVSKREIVEPQPHKVIVKSLKDAASIFTPERISLLQTIREKKPNSVMELAAMLNRKQSEVLSDLKYLEGFRLVELTQKRPDIGYDIVHITIPIKLTV